MEAEERTGCGLAAMAVGLLVSWLILTSAVARHEVQHGITSHGGE